MSDAALCAGDAEDNVLSAALADEFLVGWIRRLRESPLPACREIGADALRAAASDRCLARPPGPRVASVQDLRIDADLPARLYRATPRTASLVVYAHGGGFVTGGLESHDSTCRRVAAVTRAAVLAVDYRLAPEHPAPAAVDDVVAAYRWAIEHSQDLVGAALPGAALAGDSAGGAVSLLAAVRLRDLGERPSALLLAYPNADMTLSCPSIVAKGKGWGLDADDLAWCIEQWVPDPTQRDSRQVSPLRADVRGLPPTVVATAEHDALRDEGLLLVQRLRAAGVVVEHIDFAGLVHGFLGLCDESPASAGATEEIFARFARLLAAEETS